MPVPRMNQERMVNRRVVRNQVSSRRPVASAAMANANGTVSPTYPTYRQGGWIAMNGFCSCGFIPNPSIGVLDRVTNGRAMKLTRIRKKVATLARVVTTIGIRGRFRRRLNSTIAAEYEQRMNSQNRIEPAWPAQSAATL